MRRSVAILAAVAAIAASADIQRSGAPRGVRYPDIKIRLCQDDRHGFEITEDSALFCAHFATMNYPEHLVNFAEHKQLAIAVAKTIADYLGSTNDIRIVHWEQPEPASTNIWDGINAWLKGKYITDEIVPFCSSTCQTNEVTTAEGN